MAVADKAARITVDLGSRDRYRKLRVAAAEEDMTLREIVIEALDYWLEHRDQIESDLGANALAHAKAESSGERMTQADVKERLGL
jgi:hypothetical protein